MTPIVSIVGKSKSGKTTLLERLVQELKSRDYRVATIKHVPHGFSFDEPGKDSWRHAQAGSDIAAVSSSDMIALIRPIMHDTTLDEIARFFGEDCDIILTEGFKHADAPKIEVHRRENGPPLKATKRLMAIVTDDSLDTKVRQFAFEDVEGLADLLERGFLKPHRERVSLYVNSAPVTLTTFPRKIISQTILAMVSCLKGVGEIRRLEVFLSREPEKGRGS